MALLGKVNIKYSWEKRRSMQQNDAKKEAMQESHIKEKLFNSASELDEMQLTFLAKKIKCAFWEQNHIEI